jgi:hypothetical protein
MAAATAFGSSNVGGLMLKRGLQLLGNTDVVGKLSPQLGDIADSVRGDLLDAGKAAVGAAVSNQVDSLTSSIHERAERLRNPGETVAAGAGAATEAAGTAGRTAGRTASSGARRATSTAGGAARKATGRGGARDEDDGDQGDYDDGDQGDYEVDDLADRDRDDYEDRDEPDDHDERAPDDYDEPDEEDAGEPAGRRTRGRTSAPASARRGNGQRRSPVSRTRR